MWDTNAQGAISLTPLVSYSAGVLLETGCGIRLVLARPEDQYGTGSLVVQMAMTVEQATELARDIQKMVEHILGSRPEGRPN